MARNDPEFRLRMPEKLKAEITEQAAKNGRSINSEIVARLQSSLGWDEYDPAVISDLSKEIDSLREDVTKLFEIVGHEPKR